ncbi:MAG: limonene,2-epoxide hydrolase [Mycobacterium sp.]|nr:limonene,2-epoxide hydrolase [Mycobacterium sp.]
MGSPPTRYATATPAGITVRLKTATGRPKRQQRRKTPETRAPPQGLAQPSRHTTPSGLDGTWGRQGRVKLGRPPRTLVLGLEISVCADAFHLGMMRSPDEVVTRFCALWSKPDLDEIASCFTEDAVYRNIPPTPSIEGREAIREFIAEFLATLDGIDFSVHRPISDHGVVMHERTDVLRRKDGVEISVPIMGVFEIADGKIATWRDYFDTAITSAFSSQ